MSVQEVIDELRALGREGYKNVLLKHGAKEPCFGVKIEELKKIQKRVKVDYRLGLGLYETGIYDAMYLAGLIADDARMTRKDLQRWVKLACRPIAGTTVPSVAAGNPHGRELALEWIESNEELVAVAGWRPWFLSTTHSNQGNCVSSCKGLNARSAALPMTFETR